MVLSVNDKFKACIDSLSTFKGNELIKVACILSVDAVALQCVLKIDAIKTSFFAILSCNGGNQCYERRHKSNGVSR